MILLTIAIPTVDNRILKFAELNAELIRQINQANLQDVVEVIHRNDNKQMTIGEKRELLYKQANGTHVWQIDDDDWVHRMAVRMIVGAIKQHNPDCIGFKEKCIFDDKIIKSSNISNKYHAWADNQDGFDYVRTPHFKAVIRKDIATSVKIPHIRWNEDEQFAKKVLPLLKNEFYIDEFVYIYRHSSQEKHEEKYGFKR